MMPSLQRRLLVVATLVVAGFLGITGLILDQAFRGSLERAQEDRLQGYLYTLLTAADLRDDRLAVPGELPEAGFHTVGSGLYARILDRRGSVSWQSDSLTGVRFDTGEHLEPGERRFRTVDTGEEELYLLTYGLFWEEPDAGSGEFTLYVAETTEPRMHQLAAYRTSLWGWLAAAAVALLVTQALVLRWGLKPLRRVATDLGAMENGQKSALDGHYPREIRGLTESLNQLIRSERERTTRYRNSLADLAHSLKTPLAVLRSTLEADSGRRIPPEAMEQIERIHATVNYQLGRAAAAGGGGRFGESISVRPVAERILNSVPRTRHAGPPEIRLDCGSDLRFPGPEGDLMEILGNLVDNACKWCDTRVELAARVIGKESHRLLELTVDDDGPGVPETQRERILKRGGRADESRPGHGIGLAIVRELVESYHGEVHVETSAFGGARFRIRLPLR